MSCSAGKGGKREKCILTFERGGGISQTFGDISGCGSGFKISYAAEGDLCTIVFDGEKLIQTRCGNVNYRITFIACKQSELIINESGAGGKLKISTKNLKVERAAEKTVIALNYLLGDGGEEVNLLITAASYKEKK